MNQNTEAQIDIETTDSNTMEHKQDNETTTVDREKVKLAIRSGVRAGPIEKGDVTCGDYNV